MRQVEWPEYFGLNDAAWYLKVPVERLLDWAFEGHGPSHEFRKNSIRYRVVDLAYFKMSGGAA